MREKTYQIQKNSTFKIIYFIIIKCKNDYCRRLKILKVFTTTTIL